MVDGWMIFKTSQKKKLGNVFIYVYFLPLNFFPPLRESETFVAFSYAQKQHLEAHICVVDSFLLLENIRLMLKQY